MNYSGGKPESVPTDDSLGHNPAPEPGDLELGATAPAIEIQLDYVHALLLAGETEQASRLLAALAQEPVLAAPEENARRLQHRVPYLHALAHLNGDQPVLAQQQLQAASALVEARSQDEARVRNLLGRALYQLERPDLAYREHHACLRAIDEGWARDPGLQLHIYVNMADDLVVLNNANRAIEYFKMALDLLNDVNDVAAHAAAKRGLGRSFSILGNHRRALLCLGEALELYESVNSAEDTLGTAIEIAASLIAARRLAEAKRKLEALDSRLASGTPPILRSYFYRQWASLLLLHGDIDGAAGRAQQSVAVARAAVEGPGGSGELRAGYTQSTLAAALHIAALVEESRNSTERADALFEEALALIGGTGMLEGSARIARSYGDVLSTRGLFAEAVEYYRQALRCQSRWLTHS